jgi:hypothetical protein
LLPAFWTNDFLGEINFIFHFCLSNKLCFLDKEAYGLGVFSLEHHLSTEFLHKETNVVFEILFGIVTSVARKVSQPMILVEGYSDK